MKPANPDLPIIGFAAWSGTGKTTLLEQLIPELNRRGLRLAVLKHAHHDFDIDQPGKDSWRLRKAGAEQVLIASARRHAHLTETPNGEPVLAELLAKLDRTTLDLILVEGFKQDPIPKIALHRAALGKPLPEVRQQDLLAVASDAPLELAVPLLPLNDIPAIADFIERHIKAAAAPAEESCDTLSPAFLSVTQARAQILTALSPHEHHLERPLGACAGLVMAEDLISPCNVPPHTNSAMDGYGIDGSVLTHGSWQVVGEVLAGHPSSQRVAAGEAVRIMTGAPLPPGVDTVVMREQAVEEQGRVRFNAPLQRGQNVRQAGEDLPMGAVAIARGTRLGAAELGLAASLGCASLQVLAPLRVALFSSGDEVQAPGEALRPGAIYDSNRFTLRALAERAGVEVVDLGILPDHQAAITQALAQAAAECDLVLSSGGVSVGNADYIRAALEQLGSIAFWRIQMRPGRPLAFGQIAGTPFFGLPGNPVAAVVCFLQFVLPALHAMQGRSWQPWRLRAQASEGMKSRPGRTEFLRGVFTQDSNGRLTVRTTGPQGSGILSSVAQANCLIEILPAQGAVQPGEWVWVHPLQGLLG
ncbi:bifunctional molybdopterin-guanine dinucleotide biosynthesis adaptor protein MobB/molybdopterin molybdotransferase MoeA [Aeromonas simiae]|uniref:Molybdopterin molybdenumtransferase n=1 Tax=Aeromonas simiae TaxID=218936 RepID=A0A5J6WV44_9GAMM|nr:bifunctional molybdopterin-guanine dinucleotide biosynthesis adaptor protein MobB/molybdopterin molybdotransferase MoeA [Aeromonas simiae]QFI54144.1 bifunctional molybdopterin-guanine dinucleotide biosynthesis adaptor protein MobB/molybdopterin molybdotransferase MoeA [Aeromonas simiae]